MAGKSYKKSGVNKKATKTAKKPRVGKKHRGAKMAAKTAKNTKSSGKKGKKGKKSSGRK